MSGYENPSEFPEPKFILQWAMDSSRGLCCGIFGCSAKVTIRCEMCNGAYCKEHKEWHKHSEKFEGFIFRNETKQKKALDIRAKTWSPEEVDELFTKIDSLNFRWKAKVLTKEGNVKYCFSYTKADMEIMAIEQRHKILKVTKL